MNEEGSRLKIWGCIGGSASVQNPLNGNYMPGNTPCVEITSDGRKFVFDAGSGFVPFAEHGSEIAALFFSHFHQDHVQGLWVSDVVVNARRNSGLAIVAGMPDRIDVDTALSTLMRVPLVPPGLTWAKYKEVAHPVFHNMEDGQLKLGSGCSARFTQVVHGETQSYSTRLSLRNGKVVVYATDVDPGASKDGLVQLAKGADYLVIDTQYSDQEYDSMTGPRPHGSPKTVAAVAMAARVTKVITFHHSRGRSFVSIEAIANQLRQHLASTQIQVLIGYDGLTIGL